MDNKEKQNIPLSALIEALLFYTGEEMEISTLAQLCEKDKEEVAKALTALEAKLEGHGLVLVVKNDSVYLGTHPDAGAYIEKLRKQKISGDLGKALLETLTVVLYKTPVPKSHIDYVRGVNTATALRYLMARGLIRKEEHGGQVRYVPTNDVLRHLGVTSVEELPDYEKALSDIQEALEQNEDFEDSEEEE